MTCANVYASVACSRVMLCAPASVRTFGDIGEMCMGKAGRFLVVSSQMAVCLLGPCVFLVLGGTLLSSMFANTFPQVTWLIIMVISVLPVCLTPTLKEGDGAAFAGCAGTVVADIIGIVVLLSGMQGHPSVPAPEFRIEQVLGAFGNFSLAFSAGVLISALQRQHSDPTKMPRIIFVTMTFISCLFLTLSVLAYSTVGCQISGNLLFSIFPDSKTGLAVLGFKADRGVAILAYLGMQLHITIAFAVFLHPAFYTLERLIIGMHLQSVYVDIEGERVQNPAVTTNRLVGKRVIQTDDSVLSSALVIDSLLPTTHTRKNLLNIDTLV
uniref:Amino Acid/Auxin Permease (AAAP) Family putative n=1 Tax=Albugo laibachii Nc14 TaxID=890382 RepID=F0WIX6_9STRA|nr:Amino Acid/Auxin Permease (AAAP) Family putative [Albugo laibachii Nc14]|eukprot:CCA21222.1 Amino Acid/Auxin Permease (AAAP) Family putative [Albugo laibachii Nc14]